MKRLFLIIAVAAMALTSCNNLDPDNGKTDDTDTTYVKPTTVVVGIAPSGMATSTKGYYKRCINEAGGVMMICEDYCWYEYQAKDFIKKVDALICPGSTSGDADGTGLWPGKRSKSEDFLISAALEAGIPILGICYGHQRLNSVMGGANGTVTNMVPDSPVLHKNVVDGTNVGLLTEAHNITIEPDSKLASLLGTTQVMVNTSHNYAVDEVSPRVRVVARADDGIVEAIEGISEPVMGVQFHPEYLYGKMDLERFESIFVNLVETAKRIKESRESK